MPKKLVERPRRGAWGPKRAQRDRSKTRMAIAREDFGALRKRGPMARHDKWLNEYLKPLQRFLRSRRGQPWDRVYSELREHLSASSTVHMHIMEHLWDMVARRVRVERGRVFRVERTAWRNELFCDGWGFYVHPRSGLLCEATAPRPRRRPRTPRVPYRAGGGNLLYLELEGQWYAVRLADERARDAEDWWDPVLGARVPRCHPEERRRHYGSRWLYAVDKRQLNRRALRRLGLR